MGELVLYYNFQDVTDNIARDLSGFNNDGTIYGATQVDGKFGKGLSFDGVDDKVEVADSPEFHTNTFTITLWVKDPVPDGTYWTRLISKRDASDGFEIVLNKYSKQILLAIWSGGTPTLTNYYDLPNAQLTPPGWDFVAAVYDGTTMYLYINGQLMESKAGAYNYSLYPLKIGWRSGGEYFEGIIDEVRIYDYALSEEEIRRRYITDLMMFHYYCAEGSGTTVTDTSIHYNNGTISGSWTSGRYGYGVKCKPDYITVSDPVTAIASFTSLTVCGWVKGTFSGSNYDRFWDTREINSQSGRFMFIGADAATGKLRARIDDGTNSVAETFADVDWLDNEWHHIAVVFDRETNKMKAYIDGQKSAYEYDISTVSGTIHGVSNGMWFGTEGGTTNFVDAVLDDIRLYQVALTDDEIRGIYEGTKDSLVVSDSVYTTVTPTTSSRVQRMLDLLPHWWNRSPE